MTKYKIRIDIVLPTEGNDYEKKEEIYSQTLEVEKFDIKKVIDAINTL